MKDVEMEIYTDAEARHRWQSGAKQNGGRRQREERRHVQEQRGREQEE
jgi:hypothetical protein